MSLSILADSLDSSPAPNLLIHPAGDTHCTHLLSNGVKGWPQGVFGSLRTQSGARQLLHTSTEALQFLDGLCSNESTGYLSETPSGAFKGGFGRFEDIVLVRPTVLGKRSFSRILVCTRSSSLVSSVNSVNQSVPVGAKLHGHFSRVIRRIPEPKP